MVQMLKQKKYTARNPLWVSVSLGDTLGNLFYMTTRVILTLHAPEIMPYTYRTPCTLLCSKKLFDYAVRLDMTL